MAEFIDGLSISYTSSGLDSVEDFNSIISFYLANQNSVMPALEALINKDAEMSMAHILRGYLLKLGGDPRFEHPIKQVLKHLNSGSLTLNKREQTHLQVLSFWVDDQNHKALNLLEEILLTHPKDMIALRIAHYMHFYAGTADAMRDSVIRSFNTWGKDELFYGFLLGMLSFGHEEAGNYKEAEDFGRQAVELNPNDMWASHAVSHVFQMQSRASEGIAWLENLIPKWSDANNFIYHLHWHKALFHIGETQFDEALAINDQYLEGALKDDFYLDVCNSTSLLWRLEFLGVNVGDRWNALASYAEDRLRDDELVFSTLHYLMIPARLKNTAQTELGLDHFKAWSQEDTNQGQVCKKVGLSLAQSIVQFGSGEFQKANSTLEDIQTDIVAIGGSHAQRHLFDDLAKYATNQI